MVKVNNRGEQIPSDFPEGNIYKVRGEAQRQANNLNAIIIRQINGQLNGGRGTVIGRSIATLLEANMYEKAQAAAEWDADKINNYLDLAEYLQVIFPDARIRYRCILCKGFLTGTDTYGLCNCKDGGQE